MVEKGDVVSVLGPNGAGKTTLIKNICRIQNPDSGFIFIDDTNIHNYKKREFAKRVSYVPQQIVPSFMTVFDSILIGRRPHINWAVTKEDEDMVWDVIRLFSMEKLTLTYLNQLSGGELQKVQIARAVVQNTDVIILDEPTNNLDVANQHAMLAMIRSIVKKNNACAVMIMHDINMALYYSDKFVFMKDGQVVNCGDKNIVTPDLVKEIYGIESKIMYNSGMPIVVAKKSDFNNEEKLNEIGWIKKK
ncbi:iron ABC transporter ATP-binding protein [Methanospirillum stamsii]|uniref:Cobalamin import ATP-binding protein BtuD n=2 Tax=Methanospirillum stamsii TaxID=1277351 RepID=A0A2V2MZD3_9EURY|nr:iron ABC transporter ATP-binding protein [Methanospirillum stamsii]